MEKSVTGRSLRQFQTFLIHEEKSPATVQKYMRELQRLTVFLDGMKIFQNRRYLNTGKTDGNISA